MKGVVKLADRFATHPLTDAGNAERFAARHGEHLRFVHGWGRWLKYDGTRWAVDTTGEVREMVVETARDLLRASEHMDGDARQRVARHAVASEKRERISAALDLASSLRARYARS